MRQLVAGQIDHKTAALLLYALQTPSANLKWTSFEPDPTLVIIDRDSVERRPIGTSAWSKVEGREYDQLTNDQLANDDAEKNRDEVARADQNEGSLEKKEGTEFPADLMRAIAGTALDPDYPDMAGEIGAEPEKEIFRAEALPLPAV